MEEGVQLSVKLGVGMGDVSVLHIGGVDGRMEYLAVGDPLAQVTTFLSHITSYIYISHRPSIQNLMLWLVR